MRVSDFSTLWTPKLDSVGSSYNGQLSCLHHHAFIVNTDDIHLNHYFVNNAIHPDTSHLTKHGKVCSIALDLPSVTLGHCVGGGRVGNVNATYSSSDPPPSLPDR